VGVLFGERKNDPLKCAKEGNLEDEGGGIGLRRCRYEIKEGVKRAQQQKISGAKTKTRPELRRVMGYLASEKREHSRTQGSSSKEKPLSLEEIGSGRMKFYCRKRGGGTGPGKEQYFPH